MRFRRYDPLMTAKRKRSPKQTGLVAENPEVVASIAATLMPRIELPTGWWNWTGRKMMDEFSISEEEAETALLDREGGWGPLEVVMDEALRQARLLLQMARGVQTKEMVHWRVYRERLEKLQRFTDRIKVALDQVKTEEFPIQWNRLTALALPDSTPEMRRRYWFSYCAKQHLLDLDVREAGIKRVVFESFSNLKDKQDPECRLLPDSHVLLHLFPARVHGRLLLHKVGENFANEAHFFILRSIVQRSDLLCEFGILRSNVFRHFLLLLLQFFAAFLHFAFRFVFFIVFPLFLRNYRVPGYCLNWR
jgi:hypothetical protein